jgi:putative hydrolase of the HAD superfamily
VRNPISIDVVLFDYGNVISRPQNRDGIARLKELTRTPADEFHALYWKDRFTYDRGHLTGVEYWTSLLTATGVPPTEKLIDELIRTDVASWLEFDERMAAWADALATRGVGRAILSNMPTDVLAGLRRARSGWLRAFTAAVFSCEAGAIKPEPAIFEHVLEMLALPAPRVLFIDDVDRNVEGARQLGLHALQFESADRLAHDLHGTFDLPLP